MINEFQFHIPVDFEKGKSGDGKKVMRLRGVASTNDIDRQGESLLNEGFDLTFFKNHGVVNYHHDHSASGVIGFPVSAKLDGGRLHVEAELFDTKSARDAYELTEAMAKSGKRKMGWSIEGKVLERDPLDKKIVKRAQITAVALTHMPINANTFADVVKAMSVGSDMPSPKAEEGGNMPDIPNEQQNLDGTGGAVKVLSKITMDGVTIVQKSDGTIDISTEKSMTTINTAALMPESLEGSLKPKNAPQAVYEEVKLTKAQIVARVYELMPQLTDYEAEKVVKAVIAKSRKNTEN